MELDEKDIKTFLKSMKIPDGNLSEVSKIVKKMVALFRNKDMTQLEINPFIETAEGKFLCLDAKSNFDDNADFRQMEIFTMRDLTQEDSRESAAADHKLNYIGLEGQIGCLVNGAGLAMATMDIIKLHGGEPANFLDVGGSANADQVEQAIHILSNDPSVKTILVNIFGGIMRCDVIAEGIVKAVRDRDFVPPLVIRLLGTNVDEAKNTLSRSGLALFSCDDLEEAAKMSVALAKIQELAKSSNIELQLKPNMGLGSK